MPNERESACFGEGERLEKQGAELLGRGDREAEDTLLRAAYHFLMCGALEHAKSTLSTLSANYKSPVYESVLKNLNYLRESRILVDILRGEYEHEGGEGAEKLDVLDMFTRETADKRFANRTSEKWHRTAKQNRLYDHQEAHNNYNIKIVYSSGIRELLKKEKLDEEQAKALASFVMLNPGYAIEARKKMYGLQ